MNTHALFIEKRFDRPFLEELNLGYAGSVTSRVSLYYAHAPSVQDYAVITSRLAPLPMSAYFIANMDDLLDLSKTLMLSKGSKYAPDAVTRVEKMLLVSRDIAEAVVRYIEDNFIKSEKEVDYARNTLFEPDLSGFDLAVDDLPEGIQP